MPDDYPIQKDLIPFERFSKNCPSKKYYEYKKLYHCHERSDEFDIVLCSEGNCSKYHFYKVIHERDKI